MADRVRALPSVLILLAAALLSGCWWIGPPFYQPDPQASSPLVPGRYRVVEAGGKSVGTIIVGRADDGAVTTLEEKPGAEPERWVFAPLEPDLWITEMLTKDTGMAIYGLAAPQPDGSWSLTPVIDCKPNEAMALAAGGHLEGAERSEDKPTCVFPTRAALEKGLRGFAEAHRPFGGELRLTPLVRAAAPPS